jgi:uncharacterized protein
MSDLVLKLERLLDRQKYELNQYVGKEYRRRDSLLALNAALNSPLVKVILGPRRCGKSTLAKMALHGRRFGYLNFEDEGFPIDVSGDDVMTALDRMYPNAEFWFFDEIQNFDRWEQFVHRLHREGRNLIITGSNAHLLSQELASALTGRHVAIKLLPFSYKEFLGEQHDDSDVSFLTFLAEGGYPEIVTESSGSSAYLGTLWDSIILKDVVRRHKIRNVHDLHGLYTLMLHSVTSRFSNESLVRSMGNAVSAPTVKKFLMYGEQAYLFADLDRFHFGARKRLKFDRKGYIYDNGFLAAKKVSTSPDRGRLLENLVFIELVRRGFDPGFSLFYFVTQSGYEVDFLTRIDGKTDQLIQVTWKMSDAKTREREIRSLHKAAQEMNVRTVRVLTFDHKETLRQGDVKIVMEPVREWLLSSE